MLLVVGALFSYQVKVRFGSVFEAFQTFLSFFQGALFSLLLFGLLTRRATAAGGVAGALVGVATAAILRTTGQLFLWTAFWSFVATSAALVVVSAVTPAKSEAELAGSRRGGADVHQPEAILVRPLYGLALYVVLVVSPRLSRRPACPCRGRSVKFWARSSP